MRKAAALAEWILSLVTSQERAAATIGDLYEEGAGPLAFWGSIAWTVLSLVGRELSAAPLEMFGLAVYGFVIAIVLSASQGVTVSALVVYVFPVAMPALSVNGVVVASLIFGWVGSFISGILVARRALGREVAACCAVMILESLVNVAMWKAIPAAPSERWYASTSGSALILLGGQLLLLAGAARVRRRRFRRS